MATLNRYECIGRLGKDPELSYTGSGSPLTKFTLAVDQGKDETLWWNVVCWAELAERMNQMLFKGALVYVEGRLLQRKYTDRNQVDRTAIDLIAANIQVLEKRKPVGPEDETAEASS